MRLTERDLRRLIRETAKHLFEAEKTGINAVDWLSAQGKSGESSLLGASSVGSAVATLKGQGPFMQRQQGMEGGLEDISLGKRIQLGPSKVTVWKILPGGRRKADEIIGGNTLKNKPVTWLIGFMFKNGASRVGSQSGPEMNPAYEYTDRIHKSYVYYTPTGFIQVDNVSDAVRAKIFNMFRNAQLNATQQDYINFYDSVESGEVKLGDVTPITMSPTSAVAEPEAARPTDVRKILSDEAEKKIATVIRILSKGKPHEVEFYKRLVSKIGAALNAIHVNNPDEVRRGPLDVLKNVDANLFQTTLKQMGLPTILERQGLSKDAYKLANWTPEEFQALRDQFVGPRV